MNRTRLIAIILVVALLVAAVIILVSKNKSDNGPIEYVPYDRIDELGIRIAVSPDYDTYSNIATAVFEYSIGSKNRTEEIKDIISEEVMEQVTLQEYEQQKEVDVIVFEESFYSPSLYIVKLAASNGETAIITMQVADRLVVTLDEYK